jgi:glycosyltransferase involved in cell wall biosynthesis
MSEGRLGVLQLIDSLEAGGSERVAVNLANHLPREHFRIHLGTSRRDGPLAALISSDVGRVALNRRRRWEPAAVARLAGYLRSNHIDIIHAHSSSLFLAAVTSHLPPRPKVVWHDHFGRFLIEHRSPVVYRLMTRQVDGVIAVNSTLLDWARSELGVPRHRSWLLENFVSDSTVDRSHVEMPGRRGCRIVCVANLRPQKDHVTLLRAMRVVCAEMPSAHLLLVGGCQDEDHRRLLVRQISDQGLSGSVSLLGERTDVPAILRNCDVGVLSSTSEGLPLVLLEYGMAGLAVVSTDVGDCRQVLDHGAAGTLVPAGRPRELGEALLSLLRSCHERARVGELLRARVREHYSAESTIGKISKIYRAVMEEERG